MKFYKYQGAGNDFVIVDNMDLHLADKTALAASMCDRRFGVGADGFIAAEPSADSDVKMAFYNSDGSIAGMCGNGIRCFSKFVTDMGIVTKDGFSVETGDGQKHIQVLSRTPLVTGVKVDMGTYNAIDETDCQLENQAPVSAVCEKREAGVGGALVTYHTHLGVPHTVIFCDTSGDGMKKLDEVAETLGHDVEYAKEFQPDRTNVNFVEVLAEDHILCSTWERGAGKTLACGTGACSSALVSHLKKGCSDSVKVTMPGGEVTVTVGADGIVYMQGTAVLTFEGQTPEEA